MVYPSKLPSEMFTPLPTCFGTYGGREDEGVGASGVGAGVGVGVGGVGAGGVGPGAGPLVSVILIILTAVALFAYPTTKFIFFKFVFFPLVPKFTRTVYIALGSVETLLR